ncbi:MAG: OmpA family protein [Bacteroidota bacterium]|nr:OmpA family protein [Bacteroidota bacterium]
MKKIAFFLCVVFNIFSYSIDAQKQLTTSSAKAARLYEKALYLLDTHNDKEAVRLLTSAVKTDQRFIEAYLVMAEVYMDNNDLTDCIKNYKTAVTINPSFFPAAYLNLGKAEYSSGRYADAEADLKEYLKMNIQAGKERASAEKLLKYSEFALNSLQHPVPFNPENLGPKINTRYDEYWPSLSSDEKQLVFTRLVPKNLMDTSISYNRQEDLYMSSFENGSWAMAQNVGFPLNTPDNEGAQSVSADGKTLYFTACNRPGGLGLCDIYVSFRKGNQWSVPQNLGAPVNSRFKETQPSISSDGKTLYFVSSRPGGKGGLDIWKSTKNEDGSWGYPVNLGDSINSPGDEESPFIHEDNKTLYFSSNDRPGMGDFDIYVSRLNGRGEWTQAKNLGYPINTFNKEEGLIVNAAGTKAYFSSDRLGADGRDIYSFDLYKEARPLAVSYVKGKVYDADSGDPLKAHFELSDLDSSKLCIEAQSDSLNGEFFVCLPVGCNYGLNVSKPHYLFYSDNFALKQIHEFKEPFLLDIPLQPVKPGKSIILKNIFFATDSANLENESFVELNKVLRFMKENSSIKIEISGHTDNTGSAAHNQDLSMRRAKAVVNYLVSKGVDSKRVVFKGYGETRPIASNDNEAGKAQNRRTEFKILE